VTPREAPGAAGGRHAQGGSSLRQRLVVLVTVAIVPTLLFAIVSVYLDYRLDRAQAERQTVEIARGLSVAVERELEARVAGLRVLALSDALRRGDLDGFRAQAEAFLSQQPPGASLGLADESGLLIVAVGTAAPQDGAPRRRLNMVSVRQVFAAGQASVSDFYRNVLSGRPSFSVDVPVFQDGRVVYDLALNPGLDVLADVIAEQRPQPGWIVTVFDASGTILARSQRSDRFVGAKVRGPLGERLASGVPDGAMASISQDGAPVLVAWSRVAPFGWNVSAGVPVAELAAPALRSLLTALAVGGGALLLSLLFARIAAERISGPLVRLDALAAAAAGGGVLDLRDTGLREVDAVARTFRATAAERAAREADFQVLAATLPSFVFMTDPAGANIYTNEHFQHYVGLTAAQLLGDGWLPTLHPDDVARATATWTASVATGSAYEIEYRFRRHDGAYRWFLGRGAPVRGEGSAILRWVGTCTDIDEQKRAEAALGSANQQLERRVARRSRELDRIVQLSLDALVVVGFDGRYRSASPAWTRITGWSVAETLTRHVLDLVHPDDRDAAVAALGHLASGEPAEVAVENRIHSADGTYRWLSWRAVAAPEEDLVYAVARDVTEERAREEQLRQSQKMEVVGQLTGGIAHDFNNLLTIIMGSLELIQRGLDRDSGTTRGADARTRRRVGTAMDGARRAAQLTHRLLAFSRRQPLQPQAVELNRLVAGMSDLLHRTLGETVAVETVLAGGLWPAQADPNQLENAILNLAVNARDAMPGGGRLTIETANAHLDENYAAGREEVSPGDYAMIAVTDTGIGMMPEVMAHVFEPFFTTKPVGQGTGLGLAQVYGFMKQSGGHVAIYSEPGEGTTVKLYLPRLRDPAAQPPPGPASPAGAEALTEGRGETVLVVEDEAGVRAFTAEVLRDAGYRVLAAEDAGSALAQLDAAPDIVLLFTDVVLAGGMNGRQLADEATRRRPDLRVLFTTGYTRNAIIHHGRLDDGVHLIGKPFTAADLTRKLRDVLSSVA
jgi:PAS domain S-box-containing protein